ncbi:MAG: type II toxin-antitoxin system VapC family toxin [Chloroflexota bacterium]
MKPKVYVETSVISYITALPSRDLIVAANQQLSQEWWHKRRERFSLFASLLVLQEARTGNPEASSRRLKIVDELELLEITDEATHLAEEFIRRKAVPQKVPEDALHIAVAAVHGMDFLVTWNFKHIANPVMRVNIELVCRLEGFEPPVICSPFELMEV